MTTSRELLLAAGERLIAERGTDVPLRDIATAAGQRNTSAVHYHFGSRENLVRAILELRSAPQEARRLQDLSHLEADGQADDLRGLVDILVRPICEVPYEQGATHYGRFLAAVLHDPGIGDVVLDPARWPAGQLVATRMWRILDDLPTAIRARRISMILNVGIALLSDHERRSGESPGAPEPDAVDDLVAMVLGMLTAPILERA